MSNAADSADQNPQLDEVLKDGRDMAAEIVARRKKVAWNPTLCSQCLNAGLEAHGAMIVEFKKDDDRILLCSLRCMALWATARGWAR